VGGSAAGMFKATVTPNWIGDGDTFWYRNDLRGGAREFILVDAVAGTRVVAFDHQKLAAALGKAASMQVDGARLPFDVIQFSAGGKVVRFAAGGGNWKCDLATYEVTRDDGKPATGPAAMEEPTRGAGEGALADAGDAMASPQAGRGRGAGAGGVPLPETPQALNSPDGKWTALVRNTNVFVRSNADNQETQLSQDGQATLAYARLYWSPDSSTLIAWREEAGDHKTVYRLQSSPPPPQGVAEGGAGREVLQQEVYELPGDKLDSFEMNVFNVGTLKQIKPDIGGRLDMQESGQAPGPRDTAPHWKEDGVHFLIEKVDRGHQRLRVFNIDARTGEAKAVIDEQSKTFIWTANRDGQSFPLVNMLRAHPNAPRDTTVSNEILYASEKSGYRHLYLVNATTGETKPIDHGDWVLRDIDVVDQEKREIWFMASGVYADQDPYLIHYGHIKFDGTEQVFMTAGNGNHHIVKAPGPNERTSYSPDGKYVIDTYNRVDIAPVTELRRVAS